MDNNTIKIGGAALHIVGVKTEYDCNGKIIKTMPDEDLVKYKIEVENHVKKAFDILCNAGIEPKKKKVAGIYFGFGDENKVFSLIDIIDYFNKYMCIISSLTNKNGDL